MPMTAVRGRSWALTDTLATANDTPKFSRHQQQQVEPINNNNNNNNSRFPFTTTTDFYSKIV